MGEVGEVYKTDRATVLQGDSMDAYQLFDDGSFSLLWLDPPYNMKKAHWDTFESDSAFIGWLSMHADEWRRILATNGSLYVCASSRLAWDVEGVLRERFNVLSRITWEKRDKGGNGSHRKQSPEFFRAYFPDYEVVFFCEQRGSDGEYNDAIINENGDYWNACQLEKRRIFGDYLAREFNRASASRKEIAQLFPSKNGNLTGCVSNWVWGTTYQLKSSIRQ